METHVYLIRALTNMHPGSGDNNYGIVDRLVQRDPTSGAPTIHTSGIKGALRQYFADQFEGDGHEHAFVENIFGSKPQNGKFVPGQVRFISADLLAIPVANETESGPPFHLVHDEQIVQAWTRKVGIFKGKNWAISQEQIDMGNNAPNKFLARHQELPVIARNYLDNGQSKNLWYEEVVPRESIFGFVIHAPPNK
ncbi:MAG: type III-B CRISPR module RAMP protein Cmr4 [Bacteroidota bacterium]